MPAKTKIVIAMWSAYGLGTVALALKGSNEAGLAAVLGALILAIATVRLFRNPD